MSVRRAASGTPRMSKGRRDGVWILVALVLPIGVTASGWLGYRFNFTPSAPLGIWRIEPLERPVAVGDLVLVCPPKTQVIAMGRERGYLRSGSCPGGHAPLIKTIAAVAGQHADIQNHVTVDGIALPGSSPAGVDGRGRTMPLYQGGRVPSGEVFLFSSAAGSFDSRYFGPVPGSSILGLAQEVLTYEP